MDDVCVVGTGPAGLTTALALAVSGAEVVCVGPAPEGTDAHAGGAGQPAWDTRTAALLPSSVRLLANLDAWESCAGAAAALRTIRILDDTRRLLRAPEIVFRAEELGAEAFAYNVPNAALVTALAARVAAVPRPTPGGLAPSLPVSGATDGGGAGAERRGISLVAGAVVEASPEADGVRVRLGDERALRARLLVGADGRASLCRQAAGIGATQWAYDQSAIACSFAHAAAHDDMCTELHRESGPLTTVPLPGRASSLVWVERPPEARRLMRMDAEAFARALEARLQGLLGSVETVGPRAAFPLSGLTARSLARGRIALVGEAAHVLPPIGAQGLNLGFRDAAMLAECVGAALAQGHDPGGDDVLAAYTAGRAGDVGARTLAIDLLNRSLLTGLLPVQAARGLALHLAGTVGPLRRLLMRQGMGEPGDLPRLMRETV